MTDSIISTGIDIGTSTSHLTLCRLKIENTALSNRVPEVSITEREIIYRSPIYFTPVHENESIDGKALAVLLKAEYEKAGINASDIQTGAVIITGESSRARNAREVAESISELSGDFVVASAGCRLESLLAGRGSGAALASRESGKTICNIDIGGGTSNYAVFENGKLVDSACLGIGGRCIRFAVDGQIMRFTESGETFLDAVAKLQYLPLGSCPDPELLDLISSLLAEIIAHAACSASPPQVVQRLLQTQPLRHDYVIDEYWFSGGVAECMRDVSLDWLSFGDLGILLGRALPSAFAERRLKYHVSELGIRATVIGAGAQSLQLSGSTIKVKGANLPLKNVPIISPFAESDAGLPADEIELRLKEGFAELEDGVNAAVSVCDLSELSYDELIVWAKTLLKIHDERGAGRPLIVLSREDIGLALGQVISQLRSDLDLLILDGVDSSVGDFIDICRPLPGSSALPLTVKTLIFNV